MALPQSPSDGAPGIRVSTYDGPGAEVPEGDDRSRDGLAEEFPETVEVGRLARTLRQLDRGVPVGRDVFQPDRLTLLD